MAARFLWSLVFFILGSLGSLVLALVWYATGWISGEEFCPHNFQMRRFTYWQPRFYSKGYYKTEEYNITFAAELMATGTLPTSSQERWDLVNDNYSNPLNREFEARFLADLLNRRSSSGDLFWVAWSSDNVELAKRFWPLVSRLAVDRLYLVIPEVFSVPIRATPDLSPAAFERRLLEVTQRQLRAVRDEAAAAGLTEDVARYDQAIVDFSPANYSAFPTPGPGSTPGPAADDGSAAPDDPASNEDSVSDDWP